MPLPIGLPDTVAAPLLNASSSQLPDGASSSVMPCCPLSDSNSDAVRFSAKSMLPFLSAIASALGLVKSLKISWEMPGLPPQ